MAAYTPDAISDTQTGSMDKEIASENGPLRTIPFLTLRNKTASEKASEFFGGERDTLHAGICELARTPIDSLKSISEKAPFHIPDEIVKVDAIRESSVEDFWQRMESTANGLAPVLYTHGFYISFEGGCRRSLLLKESLGMEGRFALFSWPFDGAITNYTHDEADLYWSVDPLREVLADMFDRFGKSQVNIVAHSQGPVCCAELVDSRS